MSDSLCSSLSEQIILDLLIIWKIIIVECTFILITGIMPVVYSIMKSILCLGDIEVTVENAQELMVAADMLEIHHVVLVGTNFLKKELHPSNAIGIYRFVLYWYMSCSSRLRHINAFPHATSLCNLFVSFKYFKVF